MKGPPPLRIELRRSRLAAIFVVLAYLASAVLIDFLPLPDLARAAAVVAVGGFALWTMRDWALRTTRSAIVGIEVKPDGRVALLERCGMKRQGRARPASYVGTWLTTVVVRFDGRRWSRSFAILPDMLSDDEMRQLRVMLRVVGTTRSKVDERRSPG